MGRIDIRKCLKKKNKDKKNIEKIIVRPKSLNIRMNKTIVSFSYAQDNK